MEYRNVHASLELVLNPEAVGALDIFKVNSTETGSEVFHTIHKGFFVGSINTNIDGLYSSEFVEEDGLSFHDGLTGKGT
jgi:hypothetical protein